MHQDKLLLFFRNGCEEETSQILSSSARLRRHACFQRSSFTTRSWNRRIIQRPDARGDAFNEKGLLHVGKRALNAGAKVLEDVSQNKSLKESGKNRAGEAFNPLNLINSAVGKRKSNTSVNSKKRKVKSV